MNKNKIAIVISLLSANVFAAGLVSPSKSPLETNGIQGARPNIMYILDNSTHMQRSYLSNEIVGAICKDSTNAAAIKACVASSYSADVGKDLTSWPNNDIMGTINAISGNNSNAYAADVAFMSPDLNPLYYDPDVTYNPPLTSDGSKMSNASIDGAYVDGFNTSSAKINLKTYQRDLYFCTKTNPSTDELKDPTKNVCRRNGVNSSNSVATFTAPKTGNYSGNPFNYYDSTTLPDKTYKYAVAGWSDINVPFYYKVTPGEYCDVTGTTCGSSYDEAKGYVYAMAVRWCSNEADAKAAKGSTKLACQKDYSATYKYPRYGSFQRYNVPDTQYTNYANWFSYYRTRFLSLKTASTYAFKDIDNQRRVGFIVANPSSSFATNANEFLPIRNFNSIQKGAFYSSLIGSKISETATTGSRLREALSRVGRYYAGKTDGINTGMIDTSTKLDPVTYSCQKNTTVIGSAGYWGDKDDSYRGKDLSGNLIGNTDNTNADYATRETASYDGGLSGATGTLADVAMYYYKTDLRSSGSIGGLGKDVSTDNVDISVQDPNPAQHMVTYAISMGVNGFLSYTPDYTNNIYGDVYKIQSSSTTCSWSTAGTLCNWPLPVAEAKSTIDDLWHASINSRGKYYNVMTPTDFAANLKDALSTLIIETSSSAAAATSSPNITSTDNSLFYTTYRTGKWDGEISSKAIDPTTGSLSSTVTWSARAKLNSLAASSRNIYYVDNAGSALKAFTATGLTTAALANFKNLCTTYALSQCLNYAWFYNSTHLSEMNDGTHLVDYLRGDRSNEFSNLSAPYWRSRDYVLGDIVNASPVYMGTSYQNWESTDPTYATFKTSTATRTKVLFAGANDGMIHAFDATTGVEKWAVIPGQLLPKMYKLADKNYEHDFYVDGSLTVMDAKIGKNWKTILVVGMGAGGNGYVALDVTNPDIGGSGGPTLLWEFCKSGCMKTDSDLGYSYGNPIITKRAFDGTWVVYVTSGYDNASGKGVVYELDLATGAILRKLTTATSTVSASNQVGIAKINTVYSDFSTDNTATAIYAGDLNGQVWKWDLTKDVTTGTLLGSATAKKVANVYDAATGTMTQVTSDAAQPITTKIEIGKVNNDTVLFFGTGKYFNTDDQTSTDINSFYGIKDTSADIGNLRNKLVQQSINAGTISSTSSSTTVDWSAKNGWFFDLISQTGERVNIDPILALGTVNVISNVPAESVCTAGGNSWYYQVDYLNGSALPGQSDVIAKKLYGGFVVGQVIVKLGGSGILKNFITDSTGSVTPTAMTINSNAVAASTGNIAKTSWRELYRK